ncbi:MAG: J domain-containing protein [Okeania sp. SIO3B5]|uniref:J domain-containing protein n=1 Tax=Okeania sp. SIO3B5 TaxID=2607811 RepID=UPI00140113E6|nr:J domain-containing protein [Okeania sp. SIO3B5]NEO57962.1 J domain-containing protein [Okeania sp. SIO3B5]
MQNFRNYYQILDVSKDASVDEIKKAYRRLARQFHPDVNPGDKESEEKFKDINEAYDILSDIEKRTEYDKFIRYWKPKGIGGRVGIRVPDFRNWDNRDENGRKNEKDSDVSDFSDFNTFVDQLLGRRREIRTPVTSTIPKTQASNVYRPGQKKTTYKAAEREVKREIKKDIEARLTLPLEKAYVGGFEKIRLEDGRSIEVNMPMAMVSGQRIRLKNQGLGGGDLYLKITIAPHDFYQLEGADIFCELPITPVEAVLGGDIEVPTLDGWVKMKLPAGVFSGQRLRLASKGYPDGRGERGDQLVEIKIVTPKEPTQEELEIYQKLREVEKFKPRKDLPV